MGMRLESRTRLRIQEACQIGNGQTGMAASRVSRPKDPAYARGWTSLPLRPRSEPMTPGGALRWYGWPAHSRSRSFFGDL